MEYVRTIPAKNPRAKANVLSKITFFYIFKTFITGYKRDLLESDLQEPLRKHSTKYLIEKVGKTWKEEQNKKSLSKKKKASLLKVLLRTFRTELIVTGFFNGFLSLFISIIQPICLGKLLNFFSPRRNIDKMEASYWAIGLISCSFITNVLANQIMFKNMHVGIKMTVACSSLIYTKILKLSMQNSEQTTVGQMMNLLTNDLDRIQFFCHNIHHLWIAPMQIVIITYIMYNEISWGSPIGLIVLLCFLSIVGCVIKKSSRVIREVALRTDDRLRLMTEIIRGIQAIKMYAWEIPFSLFIENARRKELKSIRYLNILNHLSINVENYGPRFCIFVSIVAYIYLGNNITVEKAFVIMSYFNILRSTVFIFFPLAIQKFVGMTISMKRLENFLANDEISNLQVQSNSDSLKNVAISYKEASATWSRDSDIDVLQNINLTIKPNSITAIIGQVGAGKSSLLYTIIRELPLKSGGLEVNGTISYSSQSPWIFASTVKQNILFGNAYDENRYNKVVEVCQLKHDFSLLPFGDKTIVGDRGISLSGGQCARINLARAVYRKADIYLFDDPLSAVDAEVGKRIFDNCFNHFLKGKTVVFVTHQIHYINQANQILVLNCGKLIADGSIEQLRNMDINLMKYLGAEEDFNEDLENSNRNEDNKTDLILNSFKENYDEEKYEEMRTLGKIRADVYFNYFRAVRSWFFVFLGISLRIIAVASFVSCDYYLSAWMNAVETQSNSPSFNNESYIIYYSAITFFNMVVSVLAVFMFHGMTVRAARNLHNNMFKSIVHAVMKFFNENPSGRILNRFSKDIGLIDYSLPETINDVLETFSFYIITLVIVSFINPTLLIVSAVVVIICNFMRIIYVRTSRSVKRLEALTRSPMFDHVTSSLRGLTTIRALGMQEKLMEEFSHHQDLHTSAWFIYMSCSRTFAQYLDCLCSFNIAASICIFLFLDDDTLPGNVGLVISQGMMLIDMIQWGIRQSSEMANTMTSVERILEYTNLEQEPPFDSAPDKKPSENWPTEGQIEFRNVYLMYDKNEEPVLRNLNFTIRPMQKIGIVGRTGAGKSSLISALFRLAYLKGDIYIDGITTSDLGIHDLRSKISIIPQEPVLFAGSLRQNLDPFEKYSDNVIWQALEDVEMKPHVESLVNGLYSKVSEGGSNFSNGQRQLLCLARTIITKNKILVLDEATASVDLHTDELIQKTVRKNFENCTVIIIAHRLHTIMDCDKVLVMDAGRVVEFDVPYNLLEKQSGYFYELVQQGGTNVAGVLTGIAKSTYENKKKAE